MALTPRTVKKPYSSPSLVPLDARAVKAKLLAKGNAEDPIIKNMLSMIDRQLNKPKQGPFVVSYRAPEE